MDARDNALVEAPVYLLSDAQLATGFADIWDGGIATTLSVDQFGVDNPLLGAVFTGSNTNGTATAAGELGNAGGSRAGVTNAVGSSWIDDNIKLPGFSDAYFYTLSEKLTVVPEPSSLGMCMLLSGLGLLSGFRRRVSELGF